MRNFMGIRIITDSASDLRPPHRPEVTVLPMTITFGSEQFLDGIELSHRQFYEKLIEGEDLPTTSQISPAQFEEAFRAAVEAGEDVVAVVLSAKLSGTCQSACIAAEDFPGRVFVVDSANATIGERILVERAVELMDAGLEAAAIAAQLEEEKGDIRLVALLDTLEYLMKGGRIGKVTATAGTLLQIKPIITFAPDGQLQSVAKVRGRNQVIDKLVAMTADRCGSHKRYNLAVANGGAPAEMELVRQKLTAALPNYDHIWDGEIDGTLSVYIGDGVLGAAVQVLD